MKYLIKILIQFLIIIFLISCNENINKDERSFKQEDETLKNTMRDSIKLPIKDAKSNIKKDSTIIIPDKIDQFSATIVYYESYIGEAYSKIEYDKYFETNRNHLDSLIDEFDKKIQKSY